MNKIYSHAYYKDLFMQLLNREELGYETTAKWITVTLCSRQLDSVQTVVYLRGKLLTFTCQKLLQVSEAQLPNAYLLLNEMNRDYPDIKFTLEGSAVCMTLHSFILKEKMVCQCLLILRRLTDILDRAYPKMKFVLK